MSNDLASIFSQDPVFTKDGLGLVYSSNLGGATNLWYRTLAGGAPIRLTNGSGPDEWASVANDGTIAFMNSKWRNALILAELPAGPSRTLATHTPYIWAPAFSPDGRLIAFSRGDADGAWHIWLTDSDGGQPRRLTSGTGEVGPPNSKTRARYPSSGTRGSNTDGQSNPWYAGSGKGEARSTPLVAGAIMTFQPNPAMAEETNSRPSFSRWSRG